MTGRDQQQKRGQISLEFIGLISFMFMMFVIFFMIINERVVESQQVQDFQSLHKLSEVVERELEIALKVEDGYMRQFSLPSNIRGRFYSITTHKRKDTVGQNLIVSFENFSSSESSAVPIPSHIIVNSIGPGLNLVVREEGIVNVTRLEPGQDVLGKFQSGTTGGLFKEVYVPPVGEGAPTATPGAGDGGGIDDGVIEIRFDGGNVRIDVNVRIG